MNYAVSDLDKEQRTAIFVMQNFVPEEQRARVDLEFIMQQLRRSPTNSAHSVIQTYPKPAEDNQSASADVIGMNEKNSEDWQALMQWSNPSLLDTVESRPVHLFQWERTYKFLAELVSGLRGMVEPSPRLEMQRKEISRFIQLLRENVKKGLTKADTRKKNNPKNVCWILWKLRGILATIPTPATKAASVTAHARLCKFHEELGIIPFPKLNQWIVKKPDTYLLYLATVCWFLEPPLVQHEAQDRT